METKKRGRPRKVLIQVQEAESDASTVSPKAPAKNQEDIKAKKLQYKHDHIDSIREQQCARYAKIKRELAVKRLLHTIMSEKYTHEQRKQVLTELELKINN